MMQGLQENSFRAPETCSPENIKQWYLYTDHVPSKLQSAKGNEAAVYANVILDAEGQVVYPNSENMPPPPSSPPPCQGLRCDSPAFVSMFYQDLYVLLYGGDTVAMSWPYSPIYGSHEDEGHFKLSRADQEIQEEVEATKKYQRHQIGKKNKMPITPKRNKMKRVDELEEQDEVQQDATIYQ